MSCFYAGRPYAVHYNVASPVVLQAPEFGVLVDCAFNMPGTYGVLPTEQHYKVHYLVGTSLEGGTT